MNCQRHLLIVIALMILTTTQVSARLVSIPTYQELFDKSDLVVIATPITKTNDTNEEGALPNIFQQNSDGGQSEVRAIGVETSLRVCVVVKGDKGVQKVVLHHYRVKSAKAMLNGPVLVYFDPSLPNPNSYLMFLRKEQDGRYAPTGGQTDPGMKAISRVPLELK